MQRSSQVFSSCLDGLVESMPMLGLIAVGVGAELVGCALAWKFGERRVRDPVEAICLGLFGVFPGLIYWFAAVNPSDLTIHPELAAQLHSDATAELNKDRYVVSAVGSGYGYGSVAYTKPDSFAKKASSTVRWHGKKNTDLQEICIDKGEDATSTDHGHTSE
eukprot:g9894.t1